MRSITALIVSVLAASVASQDLLFIDELEFQEYGEATGPLEFSAKVVTEDDFQAMTTADFTKYKAIVISDPACGSSVDSLKFLNDSKTVWSPAITGNIILIGTDPSFHFTAASGAKVLIDNAIKFAAAGNSTGLYFSLSCYYDTIDSATIDVLSEFGEFTARGNLDCYNKAHIVASSPALGDLDDTALSNWNCSVHEAFASYPSVGVNSFQVLAIAQDIIGAGSQTFGDKTIGLPYILSRGATPASCGDGKWESDLGEECDDGNTTDGDGCSLSCKCESGKPRGDGTCESIMPSNSSTRATTSIVITPSSGTRVSHVTPSSGITIPFSNSTAISNDPISATAISSAASSYKSNSTATNNNTLFATKASSTSEFYITDSAGISNDPLTATISSSTSNIYVTSAPYSRQTIIGVEVIIVISISEECHVFNPTSTLTTYHTSTCSTLNRPIYDIPKTGYPCYPCALSSEGYTCPSSAFITASTTSCARYPPGYTYKPVPPIIKTCKHCTPITLATCPAASYSLVPGIDFVVVAPSVAKHEHQQTDTTTLTSESRLYTLTDIATATPLYGLPTGVPMHVPVSTVGYITPSNLISYTGGAAGGKIKTRYGVVGWMFLAVAMAI